MIPLDKALSSTLLYNPSSRSWDEGPPMTPPRSCHGTVAISSHEVMVAGGSTDEKRFDMGLVQVYDLRKGTVTAKAGLPNPRCIELAYFFNKVYFA